jgi:hypothetical protein
MAEVTGAFTTDPFYALSAQIQAVNTKVSDSVFENYKLQVAQSNDINNRAMQTAFHTDQALAATKQAVNDANTAAMLAAARTDALVMQEAARTREAVMGQAELTRQLINGINRENLNTALINTNTALTGLNGLYGGLGLAYGGAVSAYQSANSVAAINALNSAISSQGLVNTGTMTGTTQTSTPTSIT